MVINRSRALSVISGAVAAPALVTGFPAIVRSQTLTPLKVGIIPVDVAANPRPTLTGWVRLPRSTEGAPGSCSRSARMAPGRPPNVGMGREHLDRAKLRPSGVRRILRGVRLGRDDGSRPMRRLLLRHVGMGRDIVDAGRRSDASVRARAVVTWSQRGVGRRAERGGGLRRPDLHRLRRFSVVHRHRQHVGVDGECRLAGTLDRLPWGGTQLAGRWPTIPSRAPCSRDAVRTATALSWERWRQRQRQ